MWSAMVMRAATVLLVLAGCALASLLAKCSEAKRSDLKSPPLVGGVKRASGVKWNDKDYKEEQCVCFSKR